jgi:hypothetical protein
MSTGSNYAHLPQEKHNLGVILIKSTTVYYLLKITSSRRSDIYSRKLKNLAIQGPLGAFPPKTNGKLTSGLTLR